MRGARVGSGESFELRYDELVLAPGARAIVPPLDGVRAANVHLLRTVPDADAVQAALAACARRAVVIGGGFIGLEAAEALRHRGLEVTVVEKAPQVVPPLDAEMAAEQVAHRLILGRLKDEVLPSDNGTAKARVEKSLKLYLRRLAPSQDERDLGDIAAVVGAI